jgi:hypothetical protein
VEAEELVLDGAVVEVEAAGAPRRMPARATRGGSGVV